MLGKKEKGVDVLIATDMVRFAWEETYDTAILVTADSDLVPVVTFLRQKGKRVIHGIFPPRGAELATASWATLRIPSFMDEFRRN